MKFCGQCGTPLRRRCPRCNTEAVPGFKFCGECGAPLDGAAATQGAPSPTPPTAEGPAGTTTWPGEPARPSEHLPGHSRHGTAFPPPAEQPAARPYSKDPGGTGVGTMAANAMPGGTTPVGAVGVSPTEPDRHAVPSTFGESEIKQATVLCCELDDPTSVGAEGGFDPEQVHHRLNRFLELARQEIERFGGTLSQSLGQGFMALFGAPLALEDHGHRAVLAAIELRNRLGSEGVDGTPSKNGTSAVPWRARMGVDTGALVVGAAGTLAVGETTQRAGDLQRRARSGEILLSTATARLVRSRVALEPLEASPGEVDGEAVHRVVDTNPSEAGTSFVGEAMSPFTGRRQEMALLCELRDLASAGEGQVVGISGEAGAGKSRLLYEHRRSLDGRERRFHGQCLSYGRGVPFLPWIDLLRKTADLGDADRPETLAEKLRDCLAGLGVESQDSLPLLLRLLGVRQGTESLDELEPQALQARTYAALRRVFLDAARQRPAVIEIEDLHWIDDTSADFLASLVEVMPGARLLLLTTYRLGYQPQWLDKSYAHQVALRQLSAADSRDLVSAILQRSGQTADAIEILDKAEGNPLFLEELARSWVERAPNESETLVPDTIQGILTARIDRLPDLHKRLLQTASVLGREFGHDLLGALWDRPEPLEPMLTDLQRWEFLVRTPSEDQSVHLFKHALTHEVAYQSLLSRRRRQLHAAVATALESRYADRLEDAYDRLIYHYPRAGDPDKTIHYLRLFAKRAARHYAHNEAARALEQALEHGTQLDPEQRDRRLVETLLQLAESLLPLARFPDTLELCKRYEPHVERVDDPALSGPFFFWLAHTHTYLGNQEACQACAQRSIRAAQACGDEATEGKACYVLGRDGFWSGQFSDGIRYSLRAVVLLERSDEPWWQGQAYWVAGFNHYVLGQLADGLEALERALAIGEALDDYRLDTSWSIGYFYASLGDPEQGIEQCQAGLERSQDPLNTAVAMGFLGHAYLQQEDLDRALETLASSVEQLRQTGMQQILGWFLVFLAEAELAAGRSEAAQATAEEALATTRDADFHYGVGLAQRALGIVALARADSAEAEQFLTQAVTTFEELQVPFEVGRAHLDLARARHACDLSDSAREDLTTALGIFETLQVPVYIEKARATASALDLGL